MLTCYTLIKKIKALQKSNNRGDGDYSGVVLVVRIVKTPFLFFALNALPHGTLQHDEFLSSKPEREGESIKSASKTEIINSYNLILTVIPHNLCHVLWARSKLQVVRPTHNPGGKITKRYNYQNMGIIEGATCSLPGILKSVKVSCMRDPRKDQQRNSPNDPQN